ncbi:MAG TPA: bifunctional folylpolyglutamate synthase/dihydrofolate synthase [Firmicutes bacterium]|jgi:dihydrofolate synthase/folylpolyglutamate synthase|nr:bifunctional folylpolyglutamate synthase/dihydrofolate synthase [Bacillota bacterium]HOQ24623.1 folylpolyglutamate synthase/dihydrofolate synthase family protein [Bacillota bacterium]HPT67968.1 folylpolyglutamate synthase/dihydrofolate synthase family protein [Bacillota bacterium]
MERVLALLGHPEEKLPAVHIGGTNGKGSTAAYLEAAAIAAGLSVGKYTSPHLSSYKERITINRQPISLENLDALVEVAKPAIEQVAADPEYGQLTEFEVSTILAFLYFAQSDVDLAIIEVGLGGRLDATNVLHPLAIGLTHIALDHQEILGPDLPSIAREKAGIIKPGVPVVTARQCPEVLQVFRNTAEQRGAPIVTVGADIRVTVTRCTEAGTWVQLGYKDEAPREFRLNLLGSHQADNAAVAYGLLQLLKEKGFGGITEEAIAHGFASAIWPGRLEIIPGRPKILLDGGHNPDGFCTLSNGLAMLFPNVLKLAVVGILDNRPVEEMAKILAGHFTHVIATRVDSANAAEPERVAKAFAAAGVTTEIVTDPLQAIQRGKELAVRENQLLVVTGSLYLVGQLRPLAFY